jgi:hypothetical protein
MVEQFTVLLDSAGSKQCWKPLDPLDALDNRDIARNTKRKSLVVYTGMEVQKPAVYSKHSKRAKQSDASRSKSNTGVYLQLVNTRKRYSESVFIGRLILESKSSYLL